MFICSGLEGPQGLCSCTWRVGRPGLVVPHSPHRFRATSGSLCARVAGLLTWQLETPRVIVLGKEVGANLRFKLGAIKQPYPFSQGAKNTAASPLDRSNLE